MNINEFAKAVHENAVSHGWWDEPRSGAEVIALCHSELSEALEEMRKGMPKEYVNIGSGITTDTALFGTRKTEGVAVEMCDCIIRILDYLTNISELICQINDEKKCASWNAKVVCVGAHEPYFTKGKIYEISKGTITDNTGEELGGYESLNAMNNSTVAQFIEIVE